MQRRDFSSFLALAGLSAAGLAQAQGAPVEGKQYRRLDQVLPVAAGKVEVLEFFMYTCPHCFAFDPGLSQWAQKHAADVTLRRMAVGFNAMTKATQKMFFALEAMGKEAEVHERVFRAIHIEHAEVAEDSDVFALAQRLGVDLPRFKQAYASFGVQSKCQQTSHLMETCGINSVPTLVVDGRFVTGPGMGNEPGVLEAESGRRTLLVADYLVKRARGQA